MKTVDEKFCEKLIEILTEMDEDRLLFLDHYRLLGNIVGVREHKRPNNLICEIFVDADALRVSHGRSRSASHFGSSIQHAADSQYDIISLSDPDLFRSTYRVIMEHYWRSKRCK